MIERFLRNPLAFAGLLVVTAMLGAGAFALIERWAAPAADGHAVRDYLLAHPEVLPEAMERLQARESERAEKAQQQAQGRVGEFLPALTKPYASAWAGNPDGDVTVVAFMDYACGYCRASLPGITELVARDPNVRVVYREFPVLGPESGLAARWALAAAEQGKYGGFHDALYAAGSPSTTTITTAARQAGLDPARAERAASSPAVEQEIAANHLLGERLAINGTPTWVVGGKLIYGAQNYDALAAAVAEARRAGR